MKKIVLLFCIGFIFQSCVRQSHSEYEIDNAKETTITFGLKLPSSSTPTTRTNGVTKDLKIEDITILVFDGEGVDRNCLYGRTGTITQTTGDDAQFTTKLIASSKAVTIHVFANVAHGVSLDIYKNRPESDVIASLTTAIDLNGATALPMHGSLTLATVDNTTTTGKTVSLLRSVASVDVAVTASDFTLEEVTAYFTPNTGRLVHDAAHWDADGNNGKGEVTAPTMPAADLITTIKTPTATSVVENAIKNQLFIYEHNNAPATGKSTRVVIKGVYDDGATAQSYWYPVDFIKKEESDNPLSNVLRNYRYTFNITSVTGVGYDSEEDASNGIAANIGVEIIEWSDGGLGDIDFIGPNWFSLESKSVGLFGDAGVEVLLQVESNIPVAEWGMKWGDAATYSYDPVVASTNFSVEKPALSSKGYLVFKTLKAYASPSPSETLHICIAKTLFIHIKVEQHAVKVMLEVDGLDGNVDGGLVCHEGGYSKPLTVETGDNTEMWHTIVSGSSADISYTMGGLNMDPFKVLFSANNGLTARVRTFTIKRDNGDVSTVTVNVTQESKPTYNGVASPGFSAGQTVFVDMIAGSHKENYEWIAKLDKFDREENEKPELAWDKIFHLQLSDDGINTIPAAPFVKEISGKGGQYLVINSPERDPDGDLLNYTAELTVEYKRKDIPGVQPIPVVTKTTSINSGQIELGSFWPLGSNGLEAEGFIISVNPRILLTKELDGGKKHTILDAISLCKAEKGYFDAVNQGSPRWLHLLGVELQLKAYGWCSGDTAVPPTPVSSHIMSWGQSSLHRLQANGWLYMDWIQIGAPNHHIGGPGHPGIIDMERSILYTKPEKHPVRCYRSF